MAATEYGPDTPGRMTIAYRNPLGHQVRFAARCVYVPSRPKRLEESIASHWSAGLLFFDRQLPLIAPPSDGEDAPIPDLRGPMIGSNRPSPVLVRPRIGCPRWARAATRFAEPDGFAS